MGFCLLLQAFVKGLMFFPLPDLEKQYKDSLEQSQSQSAPVMETVL